MVSILVTCALTGVWCVCVCVCVHPLTHVCAIAAFGGLEAAFCSHLSEAEVLEGVELLITQGAVLWGMLRMRSLRTGGRCARTGARTYRITHLIAVAHQEDPQQRLHAGRGEAAGGCGWGVAFENLGFGRVKYGWL
jgi:hypothetical protein